MLLSLFIFISSFHTIDIGSTLVIPVGGGERRYPIEKRAALGGPSAVLRFEPEYFDYPGLNDIIAAASSSRKAFNNVQKKRQVDKEQAAFALRVNPVIPRNPLSVRNYSKECQEKKTWCAELPSPKPKICPPADTPIPYTSTCGPTKPQSSNNAYAYCNFENTASPMIRDPCDECVTVVTRAPTTEYVACVSMPPPTSFARIRLCSPTLRACHMMPCTYRSIVDVTTTEPPPTAPRCDIGSEVTQKTADVKYYVLVKRSPGSWRTIRNRPKRRFRIVAEPLSRRQNT